MADDASQPHTSVAATSPRQNPLDVDTARALLAGEIAGAESTQAPAVAISGVQATRLRISESRQRGCSQPGR